MAKKLDLSKIYDDAVKEAANIMSYKQIAMNAMFVVQQKCIKTKCKKCEYEKNQNASV